MKDMTKKLKDLKMKRGYHEMMYFLRVYNVRKDTIGYELLQTAIMCYLNDPKLQLNDLVAVSSINSPMPLKSERTCLEEIKESLVNTTYKKWYDTDENVFDFIKYVATKIRMKNLIDIRIESMGLEVSYNLKEAFCCLAIKRMHNPEYRFSEILNYCAGRYRYDSVDDLLIELYKFVDNSENYSIDEKDYEEKLEEIEELIDILINEHEKLIF